MLRRQARRDPVTPALFAALLTRDGGCLAPRLDATAGLCRDRWGRPVAWNAEHALTVEHVHPGYGLMGIRAPSALGSCVLLCAGHGVQSWELAHKGLLRDYLASKAAA